MDYPEWHGVAWVASDRTGALAVFFTAGYAPMPAIVLECDEEKFDTLETNLRLLPVLSSTSDALNSPDEYAIRGLYVFDWSDIHGGRLNAYERIARPSVPISINDLTGVLRAHFEVAVFDVEFKNMPVLDVRTYLTCVEPTDHPYQLDWAAKHPEWQRAKEQKSGLLVSAVKAFRRAIRL